MPLHRATPRRRCVERNLRAAYLHARLCGAIHQAQLLEAPGSRLTIRSSVDPQSSLRLSLMPMLCPSLRSAPLVPVQNKKNTPERMELKKYNKYLRRYTLHKVCGQTAGTADTSTHGTLLPLLSEFDMFTSSCAALEMPCRKSSNNSSVLAHVRASRHSPAHFCPQQAQPPSWTPRTPSALFIA